MNQADFKWYIDQHYKFSADKFRKWLKMDQDVGRLIDETDSKFSFARKIAAMTDEEFVLWKLGQ